MIRSILFIAYIFTLLPSARTQLVSNGATISVKQGTNLVLTNISLQNDGVFNQTAGTVIFSGNTPNTISGSMATSFHILRLQKTGGSLQLQRDIAINNELQFDQGILQLNNNNILLAPTATLSGESEASHISGATGGYVEITAPLNAPLAANPANLGAVITAAQNLGPVIIRRGHQSQTNGGGGGNSILRYYEIIPATNISLNATLRFNYLDAELNGLDENNLTIWKNSGAGWANLGRTGGNIAMNFVTTNGLNDLARFTLSVPGNALPLSWRSFTAQCVSGKVRIGWITEQEQNTAVFIIRRSSNGTDWSTIGTLAAAGNSNRQLAYTFIDSDPSPAAAYYQVQEKDLDGKMTFSPVISTDCQPVQAFKVYPNPVQRYCYVSISNAVAGTAMLRLYDSKGSLVLQRRETVQRGSSLLQLDMATIASGMYSLVIVLPDASVNTVKVEKYRSGY